MTGLLASAAEGDEEAWAALVDRYGNLVWAIVLNHGLRDADAADVVQTVWLRLVEHLHRIADPRQLPAWLSTTTRRECMRVARDDPRLAPWLDELALEFADAAGLQPESETSAAERLDLKAALLELDPRCNLLLRLTAVDAPLSYVSQALDIPVASILPTRKRCLDKLRRVVEARSVDADDARSAFVSAPVEEGAPVRASGALVAAGTAVASRLHHRIIPFDELVGGQGEQAVLAEPVAAAGYVVVTREDLTAALEAERPLRPRNITQGQSPGAVELMRSLARVFEGARLVGPGTEAALHPLAERIGPMLSTNDVVRATRTTRQNVAAQAKKRRLIRLASSERTHWWPTFQFRRAGSKVVPHPGVQALWQMLAEGTVSDWDHAAWLCTPRHDLSGDAPLDLATDPQAVERSPLREVVTAYVDRLTR